MSLSNRRSNIRTDPSDPTEANKSLPPPARVKAISWTSLSWAISCVFTLPDTFPITWPVSSPHIVHVVSILEAPSMFGSVSFQSNEVSGAQNSEFLFCKWWWSWEWDLCRRSFTRGVYLRCLACIPAGLHCRLLSTVVNSPLQLQPNLVTVPPAIQRITRLGLVMHWQTWSGTHIILVGG